MRVCTKHGIMGCPPDCTAEKLGPSGERLNPFDAQRSGVLSIGAKDFVPSISEMSLEEWLTELVASASEHIYEYEQCRYVKTPQVIQLAFLNRLLAFVEMGKQCGEHEILSYLTRAIDKLRGEL